MTYAVSGSTGALGSLAIENLLKLNIPASSIVALARSESKASALKAKGVQVRLIDYEKIDTLNSALNGVDRLLLVSGSEVGRRLPQHSNVLEAAKKAGVQRLVYTSISRADTSTNPLAPEHKGTEELLQKSGLNYVILRNNWYTENYVNDVKLAKDLGFIEAAAGSGKVASASRSDYAEAAAKILVADAVEKNLYELTGSLWDFSDLAKAASEVLGKPVKYLASSAEDRKAHLLQAGLDEGTAGFVLALDLAIAAGTLNVSSPDLEKILGRKPKSLLEGLKAALA